MTRVLRMCLISAITISFLIFCSRPTSPDFDNVYDVEGDAYIPLPDISTGSILGVTAFGATSGGFFSNNYGKPVTEKGVCWSLSENPTTKDTCTNDGEGLEPFVSILTNLLPGKIYYIRAYASNEDGTIYGEQRSFETMDGFLQLGGVTLNEVKALSAHANGRIIENRGAEILDWGLCYATSQEPELGEAICVSAINQQIIGSKGKQGRSIETKNHLINDSELYEISQNSVLESTSLSTLSSANYTPAEIKIETLLSQETDPEHSGIFNQSPSQKHIESHNKNPELLFNLVFSHTLIELTPDRTYYIRVFALKKEEIMYGPQESFKTRDGIVQLTTANPLQVMAFTARLGGNIIYDGGENVTTRGVCFGTQPNPGFSDTCVSSGAGIGSFEVTIQQLIPDTQYFTRAFATNGVGTVFGNERSFTTRDGIVQLTTANPTQVTAFTAWVGGSIANDGGAGITSRGVCYGTQPNPGFSDTCVSSGAGIGSFGVTIHPLALDTQYFVRAYATNAVGTVFGNERSFTTRNGIVQLTTANPTQVMAFTAWVGGSIANDGGAGITSRGVCYGTQPNPGFSDTCVSSGAGIGSFGVTIQSLALDTQYFVRAYATNAVGTVFGNQQSFRTRNGVPSLTTTKPFDVRRTSARTGGNITNNGGAVITAAGVCYVQGFTAPTLDDTCIPRTPGLNTFELLLEDLIPGKTYTVRAYATNQFVTAWGDIYNFTTLDWPIDTETAVVNVINPTTGRTWMDRNLGATHVATSSTDSEAFGDLYQWGRAADGHQKRNSPTTSTLSSTDQPGHGDFILAPNSPFDWRSPQNDNLWQGVNGINNPCPSGYRLPTEAEWNAERNSWSSNNASGAFSSPLKLPMAGYRNRSSGSLLNVGSNGFYWSRTVSGSFARYLYFDSSDANMYSGSRAHGIAVRCLEDY